MVDKQASKTYRKLITANSEYEAFRIIERLDPAAAKNVLTVLFLNKNQFSKQ